MALVEGVDNKPKAPPKFISDDDMTKLAPQAASMPKFISDEDIDKFDKPIGRTRAGLATTLDAATLGTYPTVSGLQAGYEAAKSAPSLSEALPNAVQAFKNERGLVQGDVSKAQEQYPYQSAALQVAGSLPAAAVLPGGSLAKSAAGGLISGAGQAIGHANTPGEAASDIGTGGLIGGGLGALGSAAKGLGRAEESLKNTSDKYALSGAGFMLKDFRNATNKGKVPELANTIRKEGLLKAGDSVSDVADKTVKALDDSGQKLDSIWDKLKEAASSTKKNDLSIDDQLNLHGFDPGLHKEEVISTLQGKLKGDVGGTQAISKVEGYLDDLAKDYPGELKPSDVRDIRQKVDQVVSWSKKTQDLPANEKAFKELASFIRGKIDTQAETAAKVGFSDLGSALKSENKRMSNLITIGDSASDKVSRNDANRFLSLTDYATGAGALSGLMAHSPEHMMVNAPIALGAAFANKGAREYGNGIMSAGTNALSQMASPLTAAQPALNAVGSGIQSASPVINQLAHRPDVKKYQPLGHGR